MLLDQQAVGVGQRQGPATSALTDAHAGARRRQLGHGREGAGDLPGDAVGLGRCTGIGARRVDERQERQRQAARQSDGTLS